MKRMVCGLVCIGMLLVCGISAAAGTGELSPLEVTAEVDRSIITIGDKVRYSVTVMYDKTLDIDMPNFVDSLGGFTVQDFGREKPENRGKTHRAETFWYVLDTYLVGAYVIPELAVVATDPETAETYTVNTPEIFIEVKSVISDGDELKDIRDIKLPVLSPVNIRLLLIIAGIVCVLAGGFFAMRFYLARRERVEPVVVLPPDVIALKELKRIAADDLIHKGQLREFYFRVSTCLRHYLEGRFALKALEQTTEEFIEDVLDRQVLQRDQAELLSAFLQQCDFVKFAKYMPRNDEAEKAWHTVHQFVEETRESEEGDT